MAKFLVPFTELREVSLPLGAVQAVDKFIDAHVIRIACGSTSNGVIKEGFNIPTREEFMALAHQIIEVTQHEERRRDRGRNAGEEEGQKRNRHSEGEGRHDHSRRDGGRNSSEGGRRGTSDSVHGQPGRS